MVIHPTREEYEEMDRIRFPFMFLESVKSERKINRKMKQVQITKLEERINKLIKENKGSFFDPRIKKEIVLGREAA